MKKQILQLSLAACLGVPASAFSENVFPADGNVGIGTSQPARKLHVNGDEIHSGGQGGGLSFGDRSTPDFVNFPVGTGERWVWYADGGIAHLWSGAHLMTITPQGNVGIGTVSPLATLDVNGSLHAKQLRLSEGPAIGGYITSEERIHIQAENGNAIHLNPGGGDVHVSAVSGGNLHVNGDAHAKSIHLTAGPASGSYLHSSSRLHVTTTDRNPLILLPNGGEVSVGALTPGGGILKVNGITRTDTLELTSDRNVKQDLVPVSGQEVLAKVVGLPISTYAYTNSPLVRRVGPMAQDFKAAFPEIGEDDKHLSAGDGIGVALAAIKGLHEQVHEKDARIAALESKLANLEGRLNTSLSALDRLSDQVSKNSRNVTVSAALQ